MKSPSSSRTQQVDYIQKRLQDFNKKLEEMIQENRELEETGEFHSHPHRFKNDDLLKTFEKERITLIKRHRKEIVALQARMVDLQRYCSSLENMGSNGSVVINRQSINEQFKVISTDQVTYYREKNK